MRSSPRLAIFGEPLHGATGRFGFGALRCCFALGLQPLGVLAIDFIHVPALHLGIEHFQGATAGVDLIVMGKIGEPFEDAEQVLVPRDRAGSSHCRPGTAS